MRPIQNIRQFLELFAFPQLLIFLDENLDIPLKFHFLLISFAVRHELSKGIATVEIEFLCEFHNNADFFLLDLFPLLSKCG